KSCCSEDKFEKDYQSLAQFVQKLLFENSMIIKNGTAEQEIHFLAESAKLILQLPAFHNLFPLRQNRCYDPTTESKLKAIAVDILNKSSAYPITQLQIHARLLEVEGSSTENIISVIKEVKANQKCWYCVIL